MTAPVKKPAPVYNVVATAKGYAVCRDGDVLKTPAGFDLVVLTQSLAESLAAEWRAQTDKIIYAQMPLMQLVLTAIDLVATDRKGVIDQVVRYAQTDLLCHLAEHPDELISRQKAVWQPVLDWCAQRFGARLHVGAGIMPITQPVEALQALRVAVQAYDDFRLTALRQAADVTGSLVLGLALVEGHLSIDQVFEAAELDATFQIEKWGDDPATASRRKDVRCDLMHCASLV